MATEFWNRHAQRYDDAIEKRDAAYLHTIRSTTTLLSRADVVLDLGCASGAFSLDIAPGVRCVYGIDTSTRMIASARRKAHNRLAGNVTFHSTDILDRSLDAHGCTAVLAFSVLHLVEDLHAVLRRINDLLPPGGLLISETPCFGDKSLLFRWFVVLAQKMQLAPPMFSLTVPALEAAITQAGLDIADSRDGDPRNAMRWIVARKTRVAG